ncbi:hypothetical protein F9B85_10550 [Heliorestis acidaminivorans]|uniref:Copper amine oxidase-like N-terminal domain-containing protein n=1 Tax=Heliorestis acidaminivorans TaxID=553427 RepID=A0A6I0EPV1_9FIRM|nr:stalk domain-containing protein [Heliorestis acidaminivorans]KAB2951987.1 hypothetical protein F9B85_10550 [Heliorestis acidaminivorans]
MRIISRSLIIGYLAFVLLASMLTTTEASWTSKAVDQKFEQAARELHLKDINKWTPDYEPPNDGTEWMIYRMGNTLMVEDSRAWRHYEDHAVISGITSSQITGYRAEVGLMYPSYDIISINGKPWRLDEERARLIKEAVASSSTGKNPETYMNKVYPKLPPDGKTTINMHLGLTATSIWTANSADATYLETSPQRIGHVLYFPANALLLLGAKVCWNDEVQAIQIFINGHDVQLKIEDDIATVNGIKTRIPKVLTNNGRALIPLDLLKHMDCSYEWTEHDFSYSSQYGYWHTVERLSITN